MKIKSLKSKSKNWITKNMNWPWMPKHMAGLICVKLSCDNCTGQFFQSHQISSSAYLVPPQGKHSHPWFCQHLRHRSHWNVPSFHETIWNLLSELNLIISRLLSNHLRVDPGGESFPRFSLRAPISIKYPISSCWTNSSTLFSSFGGLGFVNIPVRTPEEKS